MKIKTARAVRDLLSIVIAHCRQKGLEDVMRIKIRQAEDGDQYIIIRFIKEVE